MFTMDPDDPHLLGGKVPGRNSWFFPAHLAGGDPAVSGPVELETVELSNRGKIWSYTTSDYPPPPPFIVTTDPWVPITVAAVELEVEKIVVLGQCVSGITPDDLHIGQNMQLTLDTLYEDDDHEFVVWKWRPADQAMAEAE